MSYKLLNQGSWVRLFLDRKVLDTRTAISVRPKVFLLLPVKSMQVGGACLVEEIREHHSALPFQPRAAKLR